MTQLTAIGIKPGNSGVVIEYQVDGFTHTWPAEWFVAPFPHLFLGSLVRCLHYLTFPWNQDVRIILLLISLLPTLNKDSILTDSLETPELDSSLDEPDAITSSVSSGCLH